MLFKSLVYDLELFIYVNLSVSDVVYVLLRNVDEEEKVKRIFWLDFELLFG